MLDTDENTRPYVRNKRRDDWGTYAAYLSGIAGIIAGGTVLFSSVAGRDGLNVLGSKEVIDSRGKLDDALIRQIKLLRSDVNSLQQGQASLTRLPQGNREAAQIAGLTSKLDAVERRQTQLEQAIMSSPEKALAMPLMRRDIDNMKDSNVQNLAAIKQSVDQIYDLTKWLLGALAIGVLSLAIANFLGRKSD